MRPEEILEEVIKRYPKLISCKKEIWETYEAWVTCFDCKGKLMVCGNGGSEADSQHIVGELMKEFYFRRNREKWLEARLEELYPEEGLSEMLQPALAAMALGSSQVLTSAYSNDVSPQMMYAQEVYGYGRKEDVLLALSTSGNSINVINAVKVSKALGITTVGICGVRADGEQSMLKELCNICIQIPEYETYLVQELTLPVYHALCRMIEAHYWGVER